jgi:hypothetical protein
MSPLDLAHHRRGRRILPYGTRPQQSSWRKRPHLRGQFIERPAAEATQKIWIRDGSELREARTVLARIEVRFGDRVGKRCDAHDNGTIFRPVEVVREPHRPGIERCPGTEGGSSRSRGGTPLRRRCLPTAGKSACQAEQSYHSQAACETVLRSGWGWHAEVVSRNAGAHPCAFCKGGIPRSAPNPASAVPGSRLPETP